MWLASRGLAKDSAPESLHRDASAACSGAQGKALVGRRVAWSLGREWGGGRAWPGQTPLSGLLLLLGNPRVVVFTAWICCSVFPMQPSGEESSSDETSHGSSPALRRRRAKKRLLSSSESEEGLPPHDVKQAKHLLSSGLNRCIILALVIAVSMGFGHFYGECSDFKG